MEMSNEELLSVNNFTSDALLLAGNFLKQCMELKLVSNCVGMSG